MSSGSESDSRSGDVEGELPLADRRQKEPSRGSDVKTTATDAQTGNQVVVIASDPNMSSARLDWFPDTEGASTGRGNTTLTGVGPPPCRSGGGQAAIFANVDLFAGHDSLGPWTQAPDAHPACRTVAEPPATLLCRHFVIRTDHSALQSLRRTTEPIGHRDRWHAFIEQFSFVIIHPHGSA